MLLARCTRPSRRRELQVTHDRHVQGHGHGVQVQRGQKSGIREATHFTVLLQSPGICLSTVPVGIDGDGK